MVICKAHTIINSAQNLSKFITRTHKKRKHHLLNDFLMRRVALFEQTMNPIYFRSIYTTIKDNALAKLSPQEVNSVLRANEYTHEFSNSSSVKSYDSNQLASNNPIEDTRTEAKCLMTTGKKTIRGYLKKHVTRILGNDTQEEGLLLGVFDGHGGGSCAQVLAKRLFNYITACLLPQKQLTQVIEDTKTTNQFPSLIQTFNDKVRLVDDVAVIYKKSFEDFLHDLSQEMGETFEMKSALERAFLRLDEDLSKEALGKDFGSISSSASSSEELVNLKTLSVAMSGAVACVAHVDGPHLHVANVGDCSAVLGVLTETDTWLPKKLTDEHNTDNMTEVNRILNEHPYSERETVIKMERLLGQLAPLRALGDFRYKWSRDILNNVVVPRYGEFAIPPNYHTPPYLTAKPDVVYHRLTPKDKFLVIASDGLWDFISPLQVVRLVGEHMSGKVTLSPLKLPRKDMTFREINNMLEQRKEGMKKKPIDRNAATHLIRNALGGTEYGIDHGKLSQLLTLPEDVVRVFRDDITITVVYFDSEYLRHCPI